MTLHPRRHFVYSGVRAIPPIYSPGLVRGHIDFLKTFGQGVPFCKLGSYFSSGLLVGVAVLFYLWFSSNFLPELNAAQCQLANS